MSGPRDKYNDGLTERERVAAEEDRARMLRPWQLYNHDVATVRTLYECAHSLNADVPGTYANTLLTAFVAQPTALDPQWHRVPRMPTFKTLRRMAWYALEGKWRAGVLKTAADVDEDPAELNAAYLSGT